MLCVRNVANVKNATTNKQINNKKKNLFPAPQLVIVHKARKLESGIDQGKSTTFEVEQQFEFAKTYVFEVVHDRTSVR